MKILIIKFRNIGDVLLMTPLVSNLKVYYKDAQIDGKVNKLNNHMTHLAYDNVDEFIEKQRYYSELSNKKKNIVKAVASPCWTFFKLYFLKLGFLDGWHGYIIAKIYAKYTFWKYSK